MPRTSTSVILKVKSSCTPTWHRAAEFRSVSKIFSHPKSVVIVRLLAELLGAQYVQLAHLSRQSLRVSEPLGKKHNLGDEGVVGHHHGHRTEAYLYLRTSGASVTYVSIRRKHSSAKHAEWKEVG